MSMDSKAVSFDGHKVTVEFTDQDQEIHDLLLFLFGDLMEETGHTSSATFLIEKEKHAKHDKWKLTRDGEVLFCGASISGLGAVLIGDVLFHLIRDNDSGLAIHAGLVSDDNNSILIPGVSGAGKTSVTTWLLTHGMRYHTDELVTIDLESGVVKAAFTRPLNVKTRGVAAIRTLVDLDAIQDQCSISSHVTMIPHRLVNPDFRTEFPAINRIIFPRYVADAESELVKLSAAEAGLELMRSNVIGRNLPAHGFDQVIRLVKKVPAYGVHYRHYDDLPALIDQMN